ncbi:MAG TPA: glycine cleavage system protein GcvH [Verrucomicrobiales bacterium]|nr:glycine cleavage system protein GcvH [Verrucomicrobiales bacterium]HCN78355.1 glycine cleavage system protein GcvH [Verrucomicrobiales bacterium]HRJ10003.1 glycine cleavage system protein GcvH [Prosthecobacter sp.]HRK14677.1 glycine cleavage system protein GcvH [Prosthecobacter sp.]
MSQVPAHLRYRDTHEWVDPAQEISPVGITDHAQAELTDVVFVDPPKLGPVTAGQQVCVIESVKAASDIYTPVSGEIVEVNGVLSAEPGLINTDPYGAGWIFKIKPSSPDEAAALMDAAAYTAHIG